MIFIVLCLQVKVTIKMAQDGKQWRALVNMVINLRVP
jgi:hypothetical protein